MAASKGLNESGWEEREREREREREKDIYDLL
jgi:hypothetical protein